jgi:hypothetical protein
MTWGGGQPHNVGDKGQRYEVTYRDPERDKDEPDKRRVFGWSDTYEGARRMVDSIMLHPVWCGGEIQDRHAEKSK